MAVATRMSSGKFADGDPCFAKVKGYIPYPAKILTKSKMVKKEKYSVLFYGEKKTADIEVGNLWPVTSESIKKLVTATSLSRKGFSAGYFEMKVEHDLPGEEVKTSSGGIGGAGQPLSMADDDEFDDDEMDFFKSIGLERKGKNPKNTNTDDEARDIGQEEVSIGVQGGVEKADEEGDQIEEKEPEHRLAEVISVADQVPGEAEVMLQSGFMEEGDVAEETFDKIKIGEKDRAEIEFEEADVPAVSKENDVIEGEELLRQDETGGEVKGSVAPGNNRNKGKPAKPTKKSSKPTKKSKLRKAAPKKKGKTLREDEMELNNLFDEKIVVKADNSFYCKDCPGFVTSVRLLARTHAQSCGSKKKQTGRRPKRISCSDCGALCEGKKGLKKHFKVSHLTTSYNCSHCLKTFKSRKNYARHLKTHDERTAVKCPLCPRTFLNGSYMRRHMKRVHRNALKPNNSISARNNADEDDDDHGTEVNFEIEVQLEEAKIGQEHSWQLNVSFPASDKARSSSFGSFFNTLGFYCKEDWNDWVKISQTLSLPLSAGGHRDDFELAWNKDGNGKEEIICIGTSSHPTLFEGEEMEDDAKIGDTAEPIGVSGAVPEIDDDVDESKEENGEDDNLDDDGAGLEDNMEPLLVICPHCKEGGFKDAWFLKRHIQRMHLVPIKCEICQTVFVDKYRYSNHSKQCFYTCPREGCSFQEKRKSRLEGHMRKHEREW